MSSNICIEMCCMRHSNPTTQQQTHRECKHVFYDNSQVFDNMLKHTSKISHQYRTTTKKTRWTTTQKVPDTWYEINLAICFYNVSLCPYHIALHIFDFQNPVRGVVSFSSTYFSFSLSINGIFPLYLSLSLSFSLSNIFLVFFVLTFSNFKMLEWTLQAAVIRTKHIIPLTTLYYHHPEPEFISKLM